MERHEFRTAVFARDGGKCVVCGAVAVDAHHLIERRLFADGGYELDNGVSVCGDHHREAEATVLGPDELRALAGITRIVLPEHLDSDARYTKWGDEELADGTRSPGEFFDEAGVQKVLGSAGMLGRYLTWRKYPRTPHLPESPGASDDDLRVADTGRFLDPNGVPFAVVATEKLDGECTTLYRDGLHARSLSGVPTPGQSRVRALWAQRAGDIPPGWRICGENVTARHSIAYTHLSEPFYVFSIWDATNTALEWDATLEWCALLDLQAVPVIYDGPFDLDAIHRAWCEAVGERESEGYVVRRRDSFTYREFRGAVAKWVRANHVSSDRHWRHAPVVENTFEPTDASES